MKSDKVRQSWRDVLSYVRSGSAVVVEHYNREIVRLIPEDDTLVILRAKSREQADYLRRLVREYGSLGVPSIIKEFPSVKVEVAHEMDQLEDA